MWLIMLDVEKIRKDFPILSRKINGKRIIYLDSTATTQKPESVIEAVTNYYRNYNANVHRSVYKLGWESTDIYENARKNVADFIGSKANEIVFTRNTTESLNLLSYSLERTLERDDRILISSMEHHSNILPWMRLEEKGIMLDYIGLTSDGRLDIEDFKSKLGPKTKIVSLVHQSNVLGTINDISTISRMAKENGSIFILDAAQSVPHMPFKIISDIDFMAFSGHKMLGPLGIGVLYGKYENLERLTPFQRGGEMIRDVDFHSVEFEDPPIKFEAGTPNVEGAVGLSAAIDYLKKIGMENVREHEKQLVKYALESMESLKNITVYGPKDPEIKGGVISFNIKNESARERIKRDNIYLDGLVHSHDVASFLDNSNVYVRSGHHCAEPLMRYLSIKGTARASFYIYNDIDDIDELVMRLGDINV